MLIQFSSACIVLAVHALFPTESPIENNGFRVRKPWKQGSNTPPRLKPFPFLCEYYDLYAKNKVWKCPGFDLSGEMIPSLSILLKRNILVKKKALGQSWDWTQVLLVCK